VYQRWIKAQTAAKLPAALSALFSAAEGAGAAVEAGPVRDTSDWSLVYRTLLASGKDDSRAVLDNLQQVFRPIVKQMSQEQELKMRNAQPDVMSLDLCFVLDCTGSMNAWIESAKVQMRAIASGILPKIQKQHPGIDLKMRFALVGYRDTCDGQDQFVVQPFEEDVAVLEQKVGQSCTGRCLHA
jgi:hypothetical protein